MVNYTEQISSLENLILAWRKLEKAFSHGDVWYDELIISAFKMNLINNLKEIGRQIIEGTYYMHPIQPIPFPKGGFNENGKLKVRQSFFVDFRDQLVWVAVFNVIGRTFDIMMPAWSYGNRQYVSMWMEIKDGEKSWAVGNHRNTTRHIYRKWTQSWPLMRKRITASLKKMARLERDDYDGTDYQVQNEENQLNDKQTFIKLKYLEDGYFPRKDNEEPKEFLYWAGIDLKEFYQKVKIDVVHKKITSILKSNNEYDEKFDQLLKNITRFTIDYSDYEYEGANQDLEDMQLRKDKSVFEGLPTGLVVAGMLANIFMIDIDEQVSIRLRKEKDVIHFRYVDDHVVISTSEEKLFKWLSWYQRLLMKNGLMLNISKLSPDGLLNDLQNEKQNDNLQLAKYKDKIIANIKKYASIDPKYPTPLMTQTLQKVSMLQGLNLNMLSSKEYEMVFGELQSLLAADLSEQEIKKSTRISFACTMLTRLIVDGDIDYEKIHYFRKYWLEAIDELKIMLFQKLSNGKPLKDYDTKDKIDKLINNCSNIVFNNAQVIDIEEARKIYCDFNINDSCLIKINESLEKGHSITRGKERHIFNMLMHALDDVPDKVRIWIRAFDYCVHHEPTQILKLYERLEKYRENSLHRLSVDFLTALINILCAENIIKATARLTFNDYMIPIDAEKDKLFIEHAKKINVEESKHFFVRDSLYILSKAFAFFDIYAEKIGMETYGSKDTFFSSVDMYHGTNLDATFWLLWVSDLLKNKNLKPRPLFTKLLNDSINKVDTKSEYFKAFFFAYLREVSITSTTEMKLPKDLNATTPWVDSSIKYIVAHMPKIVGLKNLLTDEERVQYSSVSINGTTNLSQWIDYANSIEKRDSQYELIHSELMSVLIMLSIIEAIEREGENKDSIQLHPDNFYFELSKLPNKWSDLISMIEQKKLLNMQYIPNMELNCTSYDYPKILNSQLPKNFSISYGLGVIFLQLLSKQKILPWALNSEQVGFEWHYVLHELQGQGRLSSLNYRIVSACLSPRQRENVMLYQILGVEGYIRETFRDTPEIQNWQQLKKELMNSLQQLRRNLISVADEAHRQLIVIDLE